MSRRKIAEIISAHREYLGGELSIEEVDGGLTRSTTGSAESQLPKLKVYQFSFEALQNRFFYQKFFSVTSCWLVLRGKCRSVRTQLFLLF